MPISVVLVVLHAEMDPHMPNSQLRAWAMAQIAHTMLPTTAGLVAMPAFAAPASPGRPNTPVHGRPCSDSSPRLTVNHVRSKPLQHRAGFACNHRHRA
jgi:hypothetical protein